MKFALSGLALVVALTCLGFARARLRPRGVVVVYSQESLPAWWCPGPRLFLAGPTWRALPAGVEPVRARRTGWRIEAVRQLQAANWRGYVFVPEFADGDYAGWCAAWNRAHPERDAGEEIVAWEHAALASAEVRFFYMPFGLAVPDNPADTQPGLTTRLEIGYWLACEPRSVVAVFPVGADASSFVRYHAKAGGARLLLKTSLADALLEATR